MQLTPEQRDRIEQYAEGRMSSEETKTFLSEVEHDEEMQYALYLELALRDNFEIIDQPDPNESSKQTGSPFDDPLQVKTLVDQVSEEWLRKRKLHARVDKTLSPVVSLGNKDRLANYVQLWPSVAAVAIIIFSVLIVIWKFSNAPTSYIADKKKDSLLIKNDSLKNKNTDSERVIIKTNPSFDYARLYKDNYRKDQIPEEIPQVMKPALLAYEDGNYSKLEKLDLYNLPKGRGDLDAKNEPQHIRELGHYYKGIAFIESKNEVKAEANLKWVIDNSKNQNLIGKATWYLALLKIKQRNKGEAVALLEAVVANKAAMKYHPDAQQLLEAVK